MQATYESTQNEESVIYLNTTKLGDAVEWHKMKSVSEKLKEYGYSVCHIEEMESIMITGDIFLTIAQMKEDYRVAKKASMINLIRKIK